MGAPALRLLPVRLQGLVLMAPAVHRDDRGVFLETYSERIYRALGVRAAFVQDNHSRSEEGTIRGLHYQRTPGQAKLVQVARGSVWDVVVDLRRQSPTFGQYEAFELDDDRFLQLFIPVGFAHGFCTRSPTADLTYKVSSYYDAGLEAGIAWDDPDLGIPWPVVDPRLSQRDRHNPMWRDAAPTFPEW